MRRSDEGLAERWSAVDGIDVAGTIRPRRPGKSDGGGRQSHGRDGRSTDRRGSSRVGDGQHDIVMVSIVVQPGDPCRIRRTGVSEWDEHDERAHQQRHNGASAELRKQEVSTSTGPSHSGIPRTSAKEIRTPYGCQASAILEPSSLSCHNAVGEWSDSNPPLSMDNFFHSRKILTAPSRRVRPGLLSQRPDASSAPSGQRLLRPADHRGDAEDRPHESAGRTHRRPRPTVWSGTVCGIVLPCSTAICQLRAGQM